MCHGDPVPGDEPWVRVTKQNDCLLASFKGEFTEKKCGVTKVLTDGGQALLYARRGISDEENFEVRRTFELLCSYFKDFGLS